MQRKYSTADHTFSVCAYKESPYLEECLLSLMNQSVKSKVIVCTSTPNDSIKRLAEKYNLELFVNGAEPGIASDWNYAYSMGRTKLVTICHQDDVYHEDYLECVLHCLNKARRPLIAFTDYSEIRGDTIVKSNKNLLIKRGLLIMVRLFKSWMFAKRLSLAFGDPICCPSVTFVKPALQEPIFHEGFRSDLDWDAWERISRMKGAFVYCARKVISHRIHEDSETSNVLSENKRTQEDYIMFQRFWGRRIAGMLTKIYSSSEKSNEIK